MATTLPAEIHHFLSGTSSSSSSSSSCPPPEAVAPGQPGLLDFGTSRNPRNSRSSRDFQAPLAGPTPIFPRFRCYGDPLSQAQCCSSPSSSSSSSCRPSTAAAAAAATRRSRPRSSPSFANALAAATLLLPLLLISQPQPTSAAWTISMPPDNFTELTRLRNITEMCARLEVQVNYMCLEYKHIMPSERCAVWSAYAVNFCQSSLGNCTYIAEELFGICRLDLQNYGSVTITATQVDLCNDGMHQLREYRCPPVSYWTLDPDVCFTTDPMDTRIRYYTDEAYDCMVDCGNYQTCNCRRNLGTLLDDVCLGTVRAEFPLPATSYDQYLDEWYSLGNYSCDTFEQPPTKCRNHIEKGVNCSKYRHCDPDYCLIQGITCPNRTVCEEVGLCDPEDGWCHYSNKANGLSCDDGVYYTYEDQCTNGVCSGTIDYCLMYNVSCIPQSPCLTGGTCNIDTGRCSYEQLEDGTDCDDGRDYTIEDQCVGGLCLGTVVNLCLELGVECTIPNSCYDVGECDPLTGLCTDATPADEERSCDDGDPATQNETCIDGLCLGEPLGATYEFLTMSGYGECVDRDYRRMGRYSGDILEGENGCMQACLDDIQCVAYGYAYPLCSIYGTARTRAPPNSGRAWSYELGTDPAGVAVEMTSGTVTGQKKTVCRVKGYVADTLEADAQHDIALDDYFNFWIVLYFSLAMSFLFFLWPFVSCILACLMPGKFATKEDIVEEIDERPRKRERKRKKKRRRGEESDSDDSDDSPPPPPKVALEDEANLRALGNKTEDKPALENLEKTQDNKSALQAALETTNLPQQTGQ